MFAPGDTISIPTNVFRGFENFGKDVKCLFAVIGGDDRGRVHWAPQVIEKASDFGLELLENGSMIDQTLGKTIPPDARIVHPSPRQAIEHIRIPDSPEMARKIAQRDTLVALDTTALSGPGVRDFPVIVQSQSESDNAAIATAHNFSVYLLTFSVGGCMTFGFGRQ